MKRYFILLFVFYLNNSFSQNTCHAPIIDRDKILMYQQQIDINSRNYDGFNPMVRLALHRVTRTNSSGGFTWSEIDQWINTLPSLFQPHSICFTVVGKDEIANDAYFNIKAFLGLPTWENLIEEQRVENAVNIYFVEGANSGGVATGFLFEPFDDMTTFPTVTVSRNLNNANILNTPVLAHEIGHCLGLFHTHETILCVENIERSGLNVNCDTCGDLLCDTPADPFLAISTSRVNDADCAYIHDPTRTRNGLPYTPDTRNIMSYSLIKCLLNFTIGQGNRMKDFMMNTSVLDNYFIPYDRTITGSIEQPSGIKFYSVENILNGSIDDVNASNNLDLIDGDFVFEAGTKIILNPGFSTSTGVVFEARIGSYSCLTPLVTNSAKTDETNIVPQYKNLAFTLYPNPTSGNVRIMMSGVSEEESYKVDVSDLSGAVVYRTNYNASSSVENSFELSTSGFANGVYIVTVSSSGFNSTKRLVVVN